MRNTLGILAISMLFLTLMLCQLQYPEFSIYLKTFSNFGTYPQTAIIFNAGLIISAIIFYFYQRHILQIYKVAGKLFKPVKLIFELAVVSLIMVALFPMNQQQFLHSFFAFILFFGLTIGIVAFGKMTVKNYPIFGKISILIGISMYSTALLNFSMFGLNGLTQGIYFLELFFWLLIIFFHSEFIINNYRHHR